MPGVEAPPMPGSAFRPATLAIPGRWPGARGPFLSPSCARGSSGDKTPLNRPQAGLIPEPDASREAKGLLHAAVPLAGPGRAGFCAMLAARAPPGPKGLRDVALLRLL